MTDKKILEKILSNTEEVKEIVVTKENEKNHRINEQKEKRKEQLKEAQKKFIQIKANVKPELYEKIKSRCSDGNISGYIMKLIDNDLNNTPSLFELPLDANEDFEELENLRSELDRLKNMNIFQRLRWCFYSFK